MSIYPKQPNIGTVLWATVFHKHRSVRKSKDPHILRGKGTAHKLRASLSPLRYTTFRISPFLLTSFHTSAPFSAFRPLQRIPWLQSVRLPCIRRPHPYVSNMFAKSPRDLVQIPHYLNGRNCMEYFSTALIFIHLYFWPLFGNSTIKLLTVPSVIKTTPWKMRPSHECYLRGSKLRTVRLYSFYFTLRML